MTFPEETVAIAQAIRRDEMGEALRFVMLPVVKTIGFCNKSVV